MPRLVAACLALAYALHAPPLAGATIESDAVQRWSDALKDSKDPAIGWFANDHDIPCAPGWSSFLCNHKVLPLGEVPLPLPSVTEPVRLNPEALDLVRLNGEFASFLCLYLAPEQESFLYSFGAHRAPSSSDTRLRLLRSELRAVGMLRPQPCNQNWCPLSPAGTS